MPSPKSLFSLAQRGVDVVSKPQDLDLAEVQRAQNCEVRQANGVGAVEPRRGFARLFGSPVDPAGLIRLLDIDIDRPADKTAWLYAPILNDINGYQFRISADGVTWNYDINPSILIGARIAGVSPFKNVPKVATIRGILFYCDGDTPINVWMYDGNKARIIGTIPPLVYGTSLVQPGIDSVTFNGASGPGSTAYSYVVVARQGATINSAASAAVAIANGGAALDANHYNNIVPSGPPVAGATTYDVYRVTGGPTQGKIGSITIASGAFTQGNGSGVANGFLATPAAPSGVPAIPGGYSPGQALFIKYRIVATNAGAGANSANSADSNIVYLPTGASHKVVLTWAGDAAAQGYDVYVGYSLDGSFADSPYFGRYEKFSSGLVTGGATGTVTFTDSANSTTGSFVTPPATPTGFVAGAVVPVPIFTDAGLVGDGTIAPVAAGGTSGASDALGILDLITDGQSLYLAVYDSPQVSNPNGAVGRVLEFTPANGGWLQLGPAFPEVAPVAPRTDYPKGTPGVLLNYLGSINFGIYDENDDGTGKAPAWTSLDFPLPIALELHSENLSFCSATSLSGDLYVGMASITRGAGTATSRILKRVQATGVWSTDFDSGVANNSGFTSMTNYVGLVIAGWWNGNGGTASLIKSSNGNGTWTTELALGVHEVPGQMVLFPDGNLYVVVGDATQATPTTRVLKRTPAGVWSTVDPSSGNYRHAGALGILYR